MDINSDTTEIRKKALYYCGGKPLIQLLGNFRNRAMEKARNYLIEEIDSAEKIFALAREQSEILENILFAEGKYEIVFEIKGLKIFIRLQNKALLDYVILEKRYIRFNGKWERIFQISLAQPGLNKAISEKLLVQYGSGAESFNFCSEEFFRVIIASIALNGLSFSDETLGNI